MALGLGLAACALLPGGATAAGDPLRGEQWNLDAINADAAHHISIGTGATVAVLDSGVQASHPDLAGRLMAGRDFVDGDLIPEDQHGHGTNVAGIIAARNDNGIGIRGAAPGARVLPIRVLDAQNRGNSSVLIAGIKAAVDAGAAVINLSLNPAQAVVAQLAGSDPLVQAIDAASRAGVVVVAAAGNDGVPLCNQPILATKILCVGAINRAQQRSSYSNYAVRVDIVAPGGERQPEEAITSAQLGGGYSAMAGTSQATPHVAAAAALLISLGLRGSAVIERLEQTDASAQCATARTWPGEHASSGRRPRTTAHTDNTGACQRRFDGARAQTRALQHSPTPRGPRRLRDRHDSYLPCPRHASRQRAGARLTTRPREHPQHDRRRADRYRPPNAAPSIAHQRACDGHRIWRHRRTAEDHACALSRAERPDPPPGSAPRGETNWIPSRRNGAEFRR